MKTRNTSGAESVVGGSGMGQLDRMDVAADGLIRLAGLPNVSAILLPKCASLLGGAKKENNEKLRERKQ